MLGSNTGTRAPQKTANAAAQRPNTRNQQRQGSNEPWPSREEMGKIDKSTISSISQAIEFLTKQGYTPEGEKITLAALSHILFLLAHSASGKILTEGIRSVALIVEHEAIEHFGADILEAVLKRITPGLERVAQVTDELTKTSTDIREATDRMHRTGEQAREDIERAAEELSGAADNGERDPTQAAPPAMSYAAAAAGQLPLTHRHTMARSRARERQILVDKAPGIETNNLAELSESELVAKANEAIGMMDGAEEEDRTRIKFVGAKKLKNGGIVYELNSDEAANWVRGRKTAFMEKFGGTSVVKERAVAVIVEYVPLSHSPETTGERRKIEGDSGLEPETLTSTRWVKPVQRRQKGQRTAHLIVRFKTAETANQAIRDGLIIAGKRTWARKMKKEPRRCLKCQVSSADHFAAECTGEDTCGTCGQEHRTADCTETDRDRFKCINCNKMGHASWDRFCPIFTAGCARLDSRDSESTYRFFPTEEPWTWEQTSGGEKDPQQMGGGWGGRQPQPQPQQRLGSWADEMDRERPWTQSPSRTVDRAGGPSLHQTILDGQARNNEHGGTAGAQI